MASQRKDGSSVQGYHALTPSQRTALTQAVVSAGGMAAFGGPVAGAPKAIQAVGAMLREAVDEAAVNEAMFQMAGEARLFLDIHRGGIVFLVCA